MPRRLKKGIMHLKVFYGIIIFESFISLLPYFNEEITSVLETWCFVNMLQLLTAENSFN